MIILIFVRYKVGDKDPNDETITCIYIVNERFFLYEIKKNGLVSRIIKEEYCNPTNINEINPLITEFSTFLTSRKKRRRNAQRLCEYLL